MSDHIISVFRERCKAIVNHCAQLCTSSCSLECFREEGTNVAGLMEYKASPHSVSEGCRAADFFINQQVIPYREATIEEGIILGVMQESRKGLSCRKGLSTSHVR